jgi:hypothetical protein
MGGTAQSENGSRRAFSRAYRGAAEHDTGVRRTGRLAKVAGGAEGLEPPNTRELAVAPFGARAYRRGLSGIDFEDPRAHYPFYIRSSDRGRRIDAARRCGLQ